MNTSELDKLKNQRDELTRKIEKIEQEIRLQEQVPVYRIADILHELLCRSNHTDGCGWYYETWQKPSAHREYWIDLATSCMNTCSNSFSASDFEKAILHLLRCYKKNSTD